jgi:Ion channel
VPINRISLNYQVRVSKVSFFLRWYRCQFFKACAPRILPSFESALRGEIESGDHRMFLANFKLRGEVLLFAVLLIFVATPFLEDYRTGEFLIVLGFYLILVTATLQLSRQRLLFFFAAPLALSSMILLLFTHLYPTGPALIMNGIILALFLAVVCVGLFNSLGQSGPITSARLYLSVSVYYLLGLAWFSLYNVINKINPGSFTVNGAPLQAGMHPSVLMYFSLATLTTVGYGDVVAVSPGARMLSALEASIGVLYIAITVARLVSAYQKAPAQVSSTQQ